MVHSCCICKISSEKDPSISFHRFPKNELLREKWLKSLDLGDVRISTSSKICSKHFPPDSFQIRERGRRDLKPSAIPFLRSNIDKSYSDDSIVPEEMYSKLPSSPLMKELNENFTMFLSDNLELFPDHLIKNDYPDVSDLLLNETMEKQVVDTEKIDIEMSHVIRINLDNLPVDKTLITMDDIRADTNSPSSTMNQLILDKNLGKEVSEDSIDSSLDVPGMISRISADNSFKWRAYFKQCTVEDFATPEMAKRNIHLGKKEIEVHQKKIKILQQQNRRLKERVARLKGLLKQCKKNNSLDIKEEDMLDESIDF